MTTIKTSNLTGKALDWYVAKCEGVHESAFVLHYDHGLDKRGFPEFHYSTVWHYAGKIIDRERIELNGAGKLGWSANGAVFGEFQYGETALIAAMRCYVASKLGDTVEVPDELMV